MGLSSPATDQVNHDLGAPDTLSGTYLYEGWSNPGLNIEISTQYLTHIYNKRAKGNVTRALQKYGGRPTYPASAILQCEQCLKEQESHANVQCSNPYFCLKKVHN
jgi:hypothetical protein